MVNNGVILRNPVGTKGFHSERSKGRRRRGGEKKKEKRKKTAALSDTVSCIRRPRDRPARGLEFRDHARSKTTTV